jgi:two-component system, NtrC family, sensor kinase
VKNFFITFFLLETYVFAVAQQINIEGLTYRYNRTTNDTVRLVVADSLSEAYSEIKPDSSIYYADIAIKLSRDLKFKLNEALGLNHSGYIWLNRGNFTNALKMFSESLKIIEDPKSERNILPDKYSVSLIYTLHITPREYRLQVIANTHFNLGLLYENTSNIEKGLFHYAQAIQFGEKTQDKEGVGFAYLNLGRLYLAQMKTDSAIHYIQRAYEISKQVDFAKFSGSCLLNLGRVYLSSGNKEKAIKYLHNAIAVCEQEKYYRGAIAASLILADLNLKEEKSDSGYYYSILALQKAKELNVPDLLLRSYTAMANYYNKMSNNDSAVKYQSLIIKIKDSLYNSRQVQQFQNLDFNEQLHKQEIAAAEKAFQNRLRIYGLLAAIAIFLVLAIILWRNNAQKQKSYALLEKEKRETDRQKEKVEHAFLELKSTQQQLIQSEKMASLGELTAGIAHEIQNPLNFVNNFSEVSNELIEEMKMELIKGNSDDAIAIAQDVKQNLEKITHHGKRADAIVKSMLQHSRANSGKKELTDINALCDEYLRLAFHGLRAKDKSFKATTKTDFDNSIGKISVVPQDLGRVIFNLANNAFYAVNEKQKQDFKGYDPTVTISTEKHNGKIEIKVKDNGNGVPQQILDKIFQPFFTTKPTGQGTGLGLSLAYDIIKAHYGEIKVESRQGEGTTFLILL